MIDIFCDLDLQVNSQGHSANAHNYDILQTVDHKELNMNVNLPFKFSLFQTIEVKIQQLCSISTYKPNILISSCLSDYVQWFIYYIYYLWYP